jgi:putative ribosome biogenesis GTPase RsgA
MLGREAEQRRVQDTIETGRAGRSTVLVVRGEPGIGKTALLNYAEQNAGDMTVGHARQSRQRGVASTYVVFDMPTICAGS